MRTFDETLSRVDGVDGWMSDDQARRLYDAASATRPGDVIVEIGSFRGRSTIVLASAAPAGVDVVAIDPHAGNDRGPQEIDGFAAEAATDHEVFNANLVAAGVADRVRHVRSFSDDAHDDVPGDVAVLLQQSLNFAGNILIFPRAQVRALDVDSGKFMTFVMSGGLTGDLKPGKVEGPAFPQLHDAG